jgi:CheY-like chemotaxis protein
MVHVLVVDGDADTRESLHILLSLLGHRVEARPDGPTALQAAAAGRFDLALLDLSLPGLNGLELAAALRRLPGATGIRLVALTGLHTYDDAARAAGFDIVLRKPIPLPQLEKLLANGTG